MSAASQPAAAAPEARPRLVLAVTHPMTARYLLRGQAGFLARRGFDIWVVASPGADLDAFQEAEGVEVAALPMHRPIRPLADLATLVRLVRLLRRLRPDLVSASTPKAGVLGMVAAWLAGVPRRVYTLRGLPLETAVGLRRVLLRRAEMIAAALAHRVVCVGPSLRRRCLELGLTDPEKATLIASGSSNGVDLQRFRPTPERRREAAELRRRWGIPEAAPVIGYVGRFTRDKGIDDLAEAFLEHVVAAWPESRLMLVGDFESADPVAAATHRRLADDPRVVITGWVADTAPYYAVMDVLALPSYREGLPNAPLEAAASERPTVGYRAIGVVDAVEDGVTGRLVAIGDVAALAGALGDFLAEPERRRAQGGAARARVERLFRRELVWQGWLDLYRELLRTPGGAS